MDIQSQHFRLKFPLRRVHCGMPLGNSDLGALVFGSGRQLHVQFGLSSCWDHRGASRLGRPCPYRDLINAYDPCDVSEENRLLQAASVTAAPMPRYPVWWPATRVPGGRFVLRLKTAAKSATLDYASGTVRIDSAAGALELIMDMGRNRLYLRDAAAVVESVRAEPMWQRLGALFGSVGFSPPRLIEEEGSCGWYQPLPADPGLLCQWQRTAFGYCLRAELSEDGDYSRLLPCDDDWAELLRASCSWWGAYWQRQPSISLPDPFYGRFWLLALYKLACATMPGGVPSSLQGPWLEDYQRPPWSCDYHVNVNVQQIYGLAFATGNAAHLLPLFDMLESPASQETMRENARHLFGIEDGLLLTHAVDDRCGQCGGMGVGAVLDFACGGWIGLLYWQYYRMTGDREFLAKRALPFMRAVMRIFEETLEEYEGRLSIPLSISAEYGCTFPVKVNGRECRQNSGRDPSNQLTCAHALLNALLAASQELGVAPKPLWLDMKARLPRFCTVGSGDGARVGIWEGQDLEVCHRHHSHLAMIYPFDISSELSEEEQLQVERAVDQWILRGMGQWSEWCYPWAIQLHIRRGFRETPRLLFTLWRELFLNESLATVYLPRFQGLSQHRKADMLKDRATHEIMQLDGTMAGATAMLEMLICEHGGVALLFAGVPDAWRQASFSEAYFPGGFRISAERRGGRTRSCEVVAERAGTLRIQLAPGEEPLTLNLAAGERWQWKKRKA
jgi:alpha-L-fucosidase 2